MKQVDFINERLCEKNKVRVYINNVDEAMTECYRVFAKQIKPLPLELQLSDFYHPSGIHPSGISTYDLYKYLK